jgi:hypothetical protein
MLPSLLSRMASPKLMMYVASGVNASCNLMMSDFRLRLYSGVLPMGGEMITFSVGCWKTMNSSNAISISLAVKLTDRFAGNSPNTFGGISSLGPPVGVTTCAQEISSNKAA